MNTKTYAIFCIWRDGDGYPRFDLETLVSTQEMAKVEISKLVKNYKRIAAIHPDMNKENNYSFFGKRKDCLEDYQTGFGGFVIEKMEVKIQ